METSLLFSMSDSVLPSKKRAHVPDDNEIDLPSANSWASAIAETRYAYKAITCLLKHADGVLLNKIKSEVDSEYYEVPMARMGMIRQWFGIHAIQLDPTIHEDLTAANLTDAILSGDYNAVMSRVAMEGLFRNETAFITAFQARLSRDFGYPVSVSFNSSDNENKIELEIDCSMKECQ